MPQDILVKSWILPNVASGWMTALVSGGILSGSPYDPIDLTDLHQHFWNFFQQYLIASPSRNLKASLSGSDEYLYGHHVSFHCPFTIYHHPNNDDSGRFHLHHFRTGSDQFILRDQKPSLFQTTWAKGTRSFTVIKNKKAQTQTDLSVQSLAWHGSMLFLPVNGMGRDERLGHNLLVQKHFHIHFRLFASQIQNFGLNFYHAFYLNRL